MSATLSPRESGEFVAKVAEHVKIVDAGIQEIAKQVVSSLENKTLTLSGFSQCEVHPKIANEDTINWIFVVDTLNFCFWSADAERWTVTWRGKTYTGYFALCAAINRALDEGHSITDPRYYSQISLRDLREILRGDNQLISIPLLNKRLYCLQEVGLTLLERFDGKFLNCITSSCHSAEKLLKIIVDNFPCFRDEAFYKDKNLSFYKRAQILIGDIWVCFKGKNEGYFSDLEKLTMFADYRVPQVLLHFRALEYSDELMEKLKKVTILQNGSEEEVEIRGCTIRAVDLINEEVKKLLPKVKSTPSNSDGDDDDCSLICNSVIIDHYLWDYRRRHSSELESVPFHRTLALHLDYQESSSRELLIPANIRRNNFVYNNIGIFSIFGCLLLVLCCSFLF